MLFGLGLGLVGWSFVAWPWVLLPTVLAVLLVVGGIVWEYWGHDAKSHAVKQRTGIQQRGGSMTIRRTKISGQDTAIDAAGGDTDVEDADIE